MCYKQNKVRNGVVGEGQRLSSSQEAESRVNVVADNANNPPGRTIQVHDGLQLTAQPQPQGPAIHWERFLPVRSLKVLLVENDDSTRHVVSALLRNCSYEVTAVADGFQAWKILEDLSNHIDLILTEVVMPFISGIALLSKIMSHKTFKHIPVVMMSSHDSMGIVFKCLSKGAVDFLVKPIRKNELKNLWQHIWRRCHSSSGSGSESGTQSKKSVKSNSVNESGNNTATSDEEDNKINSPNIQDGSDSGSGTQSSWTKAVVKVGSPHQVPAREQSTDAPDSTCAQVIHTKHDTINRQLMHVTETKEWQEHDQQLVDSKPFDRRLAEQDNEILSGKLRDKDHKRSRENVDIRNPQTESRACDGPSALSSISQFKNSGELPSLELSLKRARRVEDTGNTEQDDRTVLRHSDSSAFSKYNTASSANQGLTGNVGSCSPLDNSSNAMKTEKRQNYLSHSNSTPPNQQSDWSNNNNDMASTKYVTLKEEALNNKSESISAFKCFHSSAFQPVQDSVTCLPQQLQPGKTDDVQVDTNWAQPKGLQQQVQVQHHHHYYHHFHHHVHDTKQNKPEHDHGDSSLKYMAATAPQCGSSNVFVGPTKGNTRNCSVNRSGSGSNRGSNGQNGSSTALKAEPLNMESDIGTARKGGAGGTSGDGGEENRVAQREAALSKFRQKRKERCFDKRVRYESRKKLAEQRPRVRGQFVRLIMPDANSSKDNQSNDLVSEDNSFDSIQ